MTHRIRAFGLAAAALVLGLLLNCQLAIAQPAIAQPPLAQPPIATDSTKAKTYLLQVMAGSPRRQITLDPPATKLVVTFESGDAAIRCGIVPKEPARGDRPRIYTSALGKPLTIERDPDSAITRFWAQDLSEVSDVLLRIESYSD